MQLILNSMITPEQIDLLVERLNWMGLRPYLQQEQGQKTITLAVDKLEGIQTLEFLQLPGVESVIPTRVPYKLASKQGRGEAILKIKGREIGGENLVVIAGPCAIEDEKQIHTTAEAIAAAGAGFLRGGAFKPRTSPYAFQGLGEIGLRYMQEAAQANGLLVVSEIMESETLPMMARYVDIFQVGARNMQNFSLLKALGRCDIPVLLKRGMSATYEDLLMAAEYILSGGNSRVILCERGIRTFETHTRNTLDIAAAPILKELSHLPVIIDPSHGTGRRSLVAPLARAAVAVGADGLLIEVHPDPDRSVSDAAQTLSFAQFGELMTSVRSIAASVGRRMGV